MYRLTVVAGSNRGSAFALQDGETSLGRQAGNTIVLPSSKVSKKHCVLVTDTSGVVVKDQGSSNGTFVNGILTKVKRLVPGDRVSVGDFVLELTKAAQSQAIAPRCLLLERPLAPSAHRAFRAHHLPHAPPKRSCFGLSSRASCPRSTA